MDQASKAPKNFNLRAFTFEDLKNNKSLISSKLEIFCENHSIHLPTKVKKISCLSQVQRRQNQNVFFCKRIEIEIVLIIHQYKFIFANHISFQLFDFLQLGNLCLQIFGTPSGTISTSHLFFIKLSHLLKPYGFKEESNQQSSFWNK